MPAPRRASAFLQVFSLCVLTLDAAAQASPAPPAPVVADQDVIKVSAEEVRIPVAAYDAGGRFDPTLSADDLLVREDGEAQRVTGVYRVPAYVLLLADTGGEQNPSKTVRLTGAAAAALVSGLRPEDRVALMQVNGGVELLQGWSTDRAAAAKAIRTQLLSGRRSALAEGLTRAAEYVRQAPAGNRHLVIVSDGLVSGGGGVEPGEAMKRLAESGVTVHVISYTLLGRKAGRPPATRPREKNSLPEEGIMSIPRTDTEPRDQVPDMRGIMEAKGGGVVDLDRLFRRGGEAKKELARRETEFGELAEETGGGLWLPATAEEMIRQAAEVAREVDSGYVVTYRPRRPLAGAGAGEYRKLDVLPRRQGLRVKSRRGYVVKVP
jgi:VWFA-related protein